MSEITQLSIIDHCLHVTLSHDNVSLLSFQKYESMRRCDHRHWTFVGSAPLLAASGKLAGSNPPARVSWWHNGERLAASAAEETEGRFFGTATTSELVIEARARHHGAVVTCEAANEAVDKRVHDAVTLGVNRKWRLRKSE